MAYAHTDVSNSISSTGRAAVSSSEIYEDMADAEILESLSSRERYLVKSILDRARIAGRAVPDAVISDEALRAMISDRAYDMIVEFETGGRAYYESPHGLNKRPCWPGGQSGVTIGCGYDLGYNSAAEFQSAWSGRMPYQDLALLAGALGKKGQAAKNYMPRVRHIIIEWGIALAVFDAVDLPTEARRTLSHLPNAAHMHPHCFGALVSLVFNRGASFQLAGDRYREMRAIRRLVQSGELSGIPAQIRAMKRLWIGTGEDGLLIRRDKEAQLFQAGLDAATLASQSSETRQRLSGFRVNGAASTTNAPGLSLNGNATPDLSWLETLTDDQLDDVLYGSEDGSEGIVSDLEKITRYAHRYDQSDVRWVSSDQKHPDYVHLPPDAKGQSFRFTAEDLETLIRCNRFAPPASPHNKLIFALRGAKLDGSGPAQEDKTELMLTDIRPDHFDFKCVIGIYDRATRKLSGFTASTVCNAKAVVDCYNYYAGFSSKKQGNILPTGCYQMCVGTHYSPSGTNIPGVFRLGTGPGPDTATRHTVLRSGSDVILDTKDIWDPCKPQDNLHPAMHKHAGFSSLGCLTVKGFYGSDHDGEWKKFRAAAGLRHSQDSMGTRYDMILLTGLDAATAAHLRSETVTDETAINEALGCLRQGSQGPLVQKLQAKLSMPNPSSVFDQTTAEKLAAHQNKVLGWASATLGHTMDGLLGFEIFGPAVVT